MRRGPLFFALLALTGWSLQVAALADPASESAPLPFGTVAPVVDSAPGFDRFIEGYTFLDSEGVPAAASPSPEATPPPVRPKGAMAPIVVVAVGVGVLLVLGLLIWRLYFDNVFGKAYRFESGPVVPRMGGTYSGGLGAAVHWPTGKAPPPEA